MTKIPEVFNYPGVTSEHDPRAHLVNAIRHLERLIENDRVCVKSLEGELALKKKAIAENEADIARLKEALDHLSNLEAA